MCNSIGAEKFNKNPLDMEKYSPFESFFSGLLIDRKVHCDVTKSYFTIHSLILADQKDK